MVSALHIREASAPARPPIEELWAWLAEVCDPEIPVVSIVDLGIVRGVAWSSEQESCVVTLTPTYSACPATAVIQTLIRETLAQHSIPRVQIQIQLSPPWTTDWLTPKAVESLRCFGIAPPAGKMQEQFVSVLPVIDSAVAPVRPNCPYCGSCHTTVISQFGSTLCKALYRCEDCLEPFDYFKCH